MEYDSPWRNKISCYISFSLGKNIPFLTYLDKLRKKNATCIEGKFRTQRQIWSTFQRNNQCHKWDLLRSKEIDCICHVLMSHLYCSCSMLLLFQCRCESAKALSSFWINFPNKIYVSQLIYFTFIEIFWMFSAFSLYLSWIS